MFPHVRFWRQITLKTTSLSCIRNQLKQFKNCSSRDSVRFGYISWIKQQTFKKQTLCITEKVFQTAKIVLACFPQSFLCNCIMGNIKLNLDLLVAEELLLRNETDPKPVALKLKWSLSSVSIFSVLKKGENSDLKTIRDYTLLKQSSLAAQKQHRSGKRPLK